MTPEEATKLREGNFRISLAERGMLPADECEKILKHCKRHAPWPTTSCAPKITNEGKKIFKCEKCGFSSSMRWQFPILKLCSQCYLAVRKEKKECQAK